MKEQEQICYVSFKIQMLYTNIKSQDEYKFVVNIDSIPDPFTPCKLNLVAQTRLYKNVNGFIFSNKKYFIIAYLWRYCQE